MDHDRYEDAAEALGTEHGRAGASWVFDGNTSDETYRECVRMDEEGDPEWFDYFGPTSGPLSGEWADSLTPAALAEAIGLDDPSPEVLDDVCRTYEDAYDNAWRDEVMRVAYLMVAP
jgi:hypothetical protein